MSRGSTPPEVTAERMVRVPAGRILLRDEGTQTNWVAEVEEFLLAPYPVTAELYRCITNETPSNSGEPLTPVTEVSWNDAVRFCNLLSETAGMTPCYSIGGDVNAQDVICDWDADGYRLPSEAEWEYACRAGTTGVRYGELDEIAWYRENSGGRVHDVGSKEPNAWGLYDMIGNVWEWCWDVYDATVYGPYRVFRGGGAHDLPRGCRASCRRKSHPTFRIDDLGFRLARSVRSPSV